ncbi:MAG: leucine-rich repeat protein [Bacteroidaceae bacterium]|nr:leucine-rich repeat protein [Bacteroidaceae bacterium]
MKKLLLLFLMAYCQLSFVNGQKVVNVSTPGTLSSLILTQESDFTVTGTINGTDAKYLRQQVVNGHIKSLNLADVKIVAGGDAYYESYTTQDDVVPQYWMADCTGLTHIVLPTSAKEVGMKAFSSSGLKGKVVIPDKVKTVGFDAFAYCNKIDSVVIGSSVASLMQGVFYSSPVKHAYVKRGTPPSTSNYLFSSNPTIHVFSGVVDAYKASSWGDYGNIVGGLESLYPVTDDPLVAVNTLRDQFFEDAACTTLKSEYQSMTDEQLTTAFNTAGMPDFMVDIALKIKNDSWAPYEKDFRIHEYNPYSDASWWNNQMKATGGSYMGNPTGILTKSNDELYVFVDNSTPSDATLYLAGCVDNNLIYYAETGQKLQKGLNIVDGVADALYYVVYTADTRAMTKTLDQWPDIKIHIEGGTVNGYYDVARHSDADYQAILKAATYRRFTVKGKHSLFNFKTSSYKNVWPTSIDKSISWFDSLTVWHKDLMGYSVDVAEGRRDYPPYNLKGGEGIFPIYYNNPNFAIEGEQSDAGWANSTPYRTSYNSIDCIRSSFKITENIDDWCANHECGHNDQHAINLEGGTEVSNNLFANAVRFLDGLVTSNGSAVATNMTDFAYHTPYFIRDVNVQLRMYYQLYLYYHQARRNTAFYPTLFKELRDDPLTIWNDSYNSSLKFVRKVCEVAQEDLTDFFTAYGFFEPFNNLAIEDYGAHTMTVKQTDINRTLLEISKYPVKNREIMFVEDRVDYVPATDMLLNKAGEKRRDSDLVGLCGDLGQYTDLMEDAEVKPGNYTFVQSDSLYHVDGEGGVGILVLSNQNGKMVYASNAKTFCIPSCVTRDFTMYSLDHDGTLREIPRAGYGTQFVNQEKAGFIADSLTDNVVKAVVSGKVNSSDFKELRRLTQERNLVSIDLQDAKITLGGTAYYESYKVSSNTVGDYVFYMCKKLTSIVLPESAIKIGSNAFARSGLQEVFIPDNVSTLGGDAFAYCDNLKRAVIGSGVKTMQQGVFYSSSKLKEVYAKPLTPPSLGLYMFSGKPTIHVYKSALEAYLNSDWAQYGTIVGDLDEYEDVISGIQEVKSESESESEIVNGKLSNSKCFDLNGRPATDLQPGTVYVRNGKKIIHF